MSAEKRYGVNFLYDEHRCWNKLYGKLACAYKSTFMVNGFGIITMTAWGRF